MCIRDSRHVADKVGIENYIVMEGLNNSELFVNALYEEVITVSYTHLRAHETVLDLVCRLLLEKKK